MRVLPTGCVQGMLATCCWSFTSPARAAAGQRPRPGVLELCLQLQAGNDARHRLLKTKAP
jgi:hypothetical protein